MAGEIGPVLRYNRMLEESLPEFRNDVERLFISILKSIAKSDDVDQEDEAYKAIYKLTRNLSRRMRKRYWDDAVLCKIIQLRKLFVDFRRFTDLPYVGYDERLNQVAVHPDYFRMIPHRETAHHRTFRASGCRHYKNLRIIFIHNRFHLLVDEPPELFWNEIPMRNGDEPPPIFHMLLGVDHDSDDDSDYANEFDD